MASGEALYGPLADRIARKHGIDPRLFRRLIRQESGWNPNAVSGAGARGLTQVVPKWHPDANLSTPAGQLEAGARYLQSGIKKYGNVRDALSQYNSGRPWSQGRNISETRNYVNTILGGYTPSSSAPGAAMPGVPPAPGAPGAGDLAPVSGSLDVRRLMQIMAVQRQRVLNGVMPSPNYQRQIARLVQQAKSGADVKAAGQQVGAQAASGASAVADAAGTYGFPSGGVDSGRVYSGGTGGDWGGSMERALAVAKAVGMTPSSQKRSRKLTASGNPSDHWIGMPNSYAVDLPTSGAAGDAKLRELSKKLGIPLKAGVWNNVNIGGYRYQIGWRTPGHFDHIHAGVRKL